MRSPLLSSSRDGLPATLEDDEVLVLRRSLLIAPEELARLAATLDERERARAARYVFERDRRQSIVSRGTLRACLGALLRTAPEALRLRTSTHDKPELEGASDLCFNVSHAADVLYLAFARGRALGVDVEGGERPLALGELAPVVFTAEERAELEAYPSDEQRAAFLRGWTRKEAYLKARAVGLSLPLSDFAVSLSAGGPVRLRSELDPEEAGRFMLVDLPAPPGHAAALAWEHSDVELRHVRLFSPLP